MGWRLDGRNAAPALVVLLLAGCATTPPPQAVTSFGRRDCAAQPDLSKAISLTPEKAKAAFVVTTPVSAETACLTRGDGAVPYLLYALPTEIEDKILTVGATQEAARLLSPDVSILDKLGRVTRSFAASDYLFRGPVYSVQFRPKPGEAYLLVAADPSRVGKSFDAIQIGTSTTTISTGYAAANWTSGVDDTISRTFSYEGTVQVTVFDGDSKK
jgi:hypothetical protein